MASRIAALACSFCAATAVGQEPPPDGGDQKRVEIARARRAPTIDGRLDDPVWAEATRIEDLHQVTPVEYAQPTEPTEVYLLYDSDMLYVAARLIDREPHLINARVLRQNQPIGPDDRFFLQIDPFGNRRSGYLFGVNPNGVRFDGVFQNITDRQFDWDGIWEAAANIDERGWTLEIAIPFKTLSFDPANDTWRMNFVRYIIRRNEQMAWASRNRNTDPITMGNVSGLTSLEQGIGLDVVPSMTVRDQKVFATTLPDGTVRATATDNDVEPSLDVFYKVTPGLNAALTINTDFSATEVDNRQINLTRFNLFFPERRDFFLQDLDIFQFASIGRSNTGNDALVNMATTQASRENGRPFFSRRLGISSTGEPVDLKYGGKLSGRVGRWDVGTLAIRQDGFDTLVPTAGSGTIAPTTAFVGRVAANLLAESSIGMIATHGDPTANFDNSLLGTDFRYVNSRLPGGRRLEADAWYQKTDTQGRDFDGDGEPDAGDDGAAGIGFRMPNNTGLRGGLGMKRIDANFYPALGFISRTGIEDTTLEFGHTWRRRGAAIQSLFSGVDAQRIEFLDDGAVQSEVLSVRALQIESNTRDVYTLRYIANKEGLRDPFEIAPGIIVDEGVYSFDEREIAIELGNQRKIAGSFAYRDGDFFDGERLSVDGSVAWRPGRHFRGVVEYQYNDVQLARGDFIARLVRLQLEAAFSSTWSWVNLIQYDNVSKTVGINSRLHWIPQAGREAFVVLNHNLEEVGQDRDFESSFSELALKFSYTLRF